MRRGNESTRNMNDAKKTTIPSMHYQPTPTPPSRENSLPQKIEEHVNPNDYLVPLNNNQTMSNTNFRSTQTTYRYHPYNNNIGNNRNSTNHHDSQLLPPSTNYENQYARTIHTSQDMQSINFSNRAMCDAMLENDGNIRNMQFTPTTTTTLLEPSVQVEPHFDSNIFTMRKRQVVASSSSSLSSLASEVSTQAANYCMSRSSSTSLSSMESPYSIDPSNASPITNPSSFSLRTISSDAVTYRNREFSSKTPTHHQEVNHPPPTLIPLQGDFRKANQNISEQPTSTPLVTQNYSLTPLNLLQKTPSSTNQSSSNNMELVTSSNVEPTNPSSYLRPLKSAGSSASDLTNSTSSATPFSDPIVLDLSNIPSTFDESSTNFNYSKTKRIKNFVNDGPWTTEEHERLLQGLQQCGPNWKEISEVYVKSRTRVQVHAYATKVLKIKSPNNADP